jgi:hypothetical protein
LAKWGNTPHNGVKIKDPQHICVESGWRSDLGPTESGEGSQYRLSWAVQVSSWRAKCETSGQQVCAGSMWAAQWALDTGCSGSSTAKAYICWWVGLQLLWQLWPLNFLAYAWNFGCTIQLGFPSAFSPSLTSNFLSQ